MLKTKMVEAGEYSRSYASQTRSHSSRLGARPSSRLAIVARVLESRPMGGGGRLWLFPCRALSVSQHCAEHTVPCFVYKVRDARKRAPHQQHILVTDLNLV